MIFNLSKLIILDLSYNKISLMESGTFSNLSLLNKLYLNNNQLSLITDNIFVGLNSLTHLDLASNYLEIINSSTFNGLSALKDLNLAFNLIHSIDPNAFSMVFNLKILDIMDNKLNTLDDNIFMNLANLSYLELSNNFLSSINLFYQTQLTYLGLYMNNFNYFSKSLPSLTFLDLGYNPLGYINYTLIESSNQLNPQLGILYLDGCNLLFLENNIFQNFQKLMNLYFDNNRFTNLNTSLFMNLFNLSKVTLDVDILNQIELKTTFPNINFEFY